MDAWIHRASINSSHISAFFFFSFFFLGRYGDTTHRMGFICLSHSLFLSHFIVFFLSVSFDPSFYLIYSKNNFSTKCPRAFAKETKQLEFFLIVGGFFSHFLMIRPNSPGKFDNLRTLHRSHYRRTTSTTIQFKKNFFLQSMPTDDSPSSFSRFHAFSAVCTCMCV